MEKEFENPISITFPCIKLVQPIGEFYIASINSKTLCDITYFDVRRILKEREIESYLGIQRPLNKKRVDEIADYVKTVDACFPTAVILAVEGKCAKYDEATHMMTLTNYLNPPEGEVAVHLRELAKVLDGQHRIEGLREYKGETFEINVSIFVDVDIATQAYIFSTVNLAQTKVNKSLAFDLFELAKARSPQKTCHNIAVALDRNDKSPFHKRVKRLGVSTEGRYNETITQATFVQSLIVYIAKTRDQMFDRDLYLRGNEPEKANAEELKLLIFRNMYIEKRDLEIADIIRNFFDAVREKWPIAWNSSGRGIILNKTNGFKAFMRFLRPAYLYLTSPGSVPSKDQFVSVLDKIKLTDKDFNIDRFKPGTSGESELYNTLIRESELR